MPKKWKKHWGNNLSPEDEQKRNKIIKTLGNLTIIPPGLNASILNHNWPTKKKGNGKPDSKGLKHYCAGIDIMHELVRQGRVGREDNKRARSVAC